MRFWMLLQSTRVKRKSKHYQKVGKLYYKLQINGSKRVYASRHLGARARSFPVHLTTDEGSNRTTLLSGNILLPLHRNSSIAIESRKENCVLEKRLHSLPASSCRLISFFFLSPLLCYFYASLLKNLNAFSSLHFLFSFSSSF